MSDALARIPCPGELSEALSLFSPDGARLLTWGEPLCIWSVGFETRPAAVVATIVRERVPWRLERGRLVPVD